MNIAWSMDDEEKYRYVLQVIDPNDFEVVCKIVPLKCKLIALSGGCFLD